MGLISHVVRLISTILFNLWPFNLSSLCLLGRLALPLFPFNLLQFPGPGSVEAATKGRDDTFPARFNSFNSTLPCFTHSSPRDAPQAGLLQPTARHPTRLSGKRCHPALPPGSLASVAARRAPHSTRPGWLRQIIRRTLNKGEQGLAHQLGRQDLCLLGRINARGNLH